MPRISKTARVLMDRHASKARGMCAALEMNIQSVEVADALRKHPRFYNNPDVLRLLVNIDDQVCRSGLNSETEHENSLQSKYDEGEQDGFRNCVTEHLEPLWSLAKFVVDNWETKDLAAAVRELAENVADIEKAKVIP